MQPDLAAQLRRIMRGETTSKNSVTCVAGVVAVADNVSKSLGLRQKRQQRHESTGLWKGVVGGVVAGVASLPEPDPIELEERKALAADSVPEVYLDGWARLQLQRPASVAEAQWRQAIDDAGLFLDRWGTRARELRWTPGDLFDVPHGGKPGGLVWFLEGEPVRALGPEHAVTISGRIFDRITRAKWQNPYKRHCQGPACFQ